MKYLVSQNEEIILPYEGNVVKLEVIRMTCTVDYNVNTNENMANSYAIVGYINQNNDTTGTIMAYYSSKEKAIKVLKMLIAEDEKCIKFNYWNFPKEEYVK